MQGSAEGREPSTQRIPDWVIAHRGASGTTPENTLAALRHARALGAAWAEVDVQSTSDGVLVLVHDETWERTAGLRRAVADAPWSVVRTLDAGRWFDPAWSGEPVPRLEEALALVRDGLRLDIEIKAPAQHPALGARVVAAIRAARAEAGVLVTSFDGALVERLAARAPEIAFGYLTAVPQAGTDPRVRVLAVHASVFDTAPDFVAAAREAGRRVVAWTVDDPARGVALRRQGAHAVVTNFPERYATEGS